MEKEILSKLMLLTFVIGFMGCVQQPRLAEPTKEEKQARAHQSAKVHTELAGEYFNRGQMEVALEEIDEALKAEPNYAPAHNVFGLINMKLNEDAKRCKILRRQSNWRRMMVRYAITMVGFYVNAIRS